MTFRTRITALVAASLACAIAAPGVANAKTNIAVGLGDQNAAMFSQPAYQALGLKKARYFIRWNAATDPSQLAAADQYVTAAKSRGVSVLMHISTNDFTPKKAALPSVASYKKYVGKLVKRYKAMGVKDWGVWNEANHVSQPTWRSPTRAASYFKTMRSLCSGCHIVALDILDQKGAATYIQKFFGALPKSYRSKASIVGIHNYSDTNRKRSTGTSTIIKAVHRYSSKTKFWLTETGGIVSLASSFPCDPARAANRTTYMFTLAKKYKSSIQRLYAYSYFGSDCKDRFDAGLVNADGSIRPSYTAFQKGAASFAK